MTTAMALEPFLRWEQRLLSAGSLTEFLSIAGEPADFLAGAGEVCFLLADPAHELRHLAGALEADGGADLRFADGLQGVAPQFAGLHGPWRGAWCVADHGLLFGGAPRLTEIVMVPLKRGDDLLGACNIGIRDPLPAFGPLELLMLEHLSSVMTASLARFFDRARLLHSGLIDPLTGWHSRRYLQSRLREEISRCQRYGDVASCLIVDVDRLREINERHGQAAGDRALAELASRIEAQLRCSDAAAHYGSDAFAVLLPSTRAELAVSLAQRILSAVRSTGIVVGGEVVVPMTVSIGIAELRPDPAADGKAIADELLVEAETAMHRAKRQGGDACVVSGA